MAASSHSTELARVIAGADLEHWAGNALAHPVIVLLLGVAQEGGRCPIDAWSRSGTVDPEASRPEHRGAADRRTGPGHGPNGPVSVLIPCESHQTDTA